ncbi:nucleotidyltransferase domain-containing protein [Desulfurispira natronophila]|uniref:Putative nucleotidyltransferase n=1 Tax=Desulfurispira natronophila TaxID=682562 RepID=A0A7W7Y4B5_9BACT|nr:nucleotidyltransferase domain-containing protein [Desulfurispira natronophila]MBB5021684.1 putative nucleotidyltransferase [Desulfurispira natronophila]
MLQEALEQTSLNQEETRTMEKLVKRIRTKYAKVVTNVVLYGSTLRQAGVRRKDLNVLIIMNQKDTELARTMAEALEQLDKKIKLDPKIISMEEYLGEAQLESNFYKKVTNEGVEVYKNPEVMTVPAD